MKSRIIKIISAVAALIVALPCAVSPVFANSGHRYEYGVTGAGAVVRNEESVLAVESEKLTFDIKGFPDYPDISGYNSTVTAEYKFVNTSENTVTTSMAFPIGVDPVCYGNAVPPEIKLNGEEVEIETRHTYGRYNYFPDDVKDICDGFFEDDFYTPETKVTEFTVEVSTKKYDDLRLIGKVICGDGARFMCGGSSDDEMYFFVNEYRNKETFYVFGDVDDFECEWSCAEYVDHLFKPSEYNPINRTVKIYEGSETTLKEFALECREKDSAVSETDWYNAVVSRLGVGSHAIYVNRDFQDSDFTAWYLYDITLAAGESAVNTVTAPIFPSERYMYSPDVYEYEYYLSPAKSWQSFGKLEIVINTDNYLVFTPSVGFSESKSGYVARLDGLPDGELYFSLCSSANPKYESSNVGVVLLTVLLVFMGLISLACFGLVIFAIVYLVKSKKRK